VQPSVTAELLVDISDIALCCAGSVGTHIHRHTDNTVIIVMMLWVRYM